MTIEIDDVVRRLLRPLDPLPTGIRPVLRDCPGVRAVLFDVYGTLLISASGDIDAGQNLSQAAAFGLACRAAGIAISNDDGAAGARLSAAIEREHERARAAGIAAPEVDIREIWAEVLDELGCRMAADDARLARLAAEYEMRVNPIWPMPAARQTLSAIAKSGRLLGIISNAQFYTPPALAALLGAQLIDLGFAEELQFYSYALRRAKPGLELYEAAAAALARHGIDVRDALYVGNDMLKDVYPASRLGFQTALFAGDARSIRWCDDDRRVAEVEPDLIVTDLRQILLCLRIEIVDS